ncbi:hypothetical protein pb186bvf_019136 [Paramecium bursaria]
MEIRVGVSDPAQDKFISFQIDSNEIIENLKALIEVEFNIPLDQQTLTYGQIQLKDNLTIKSYNIQNDDVILVMRKPKKQKNPLQIEANKMIKYYTTTPGALFQLKNSNPQLATAIENKDIATIISIIKQEQQKKLLQQQEYMRKLAQLEADPLNPENQKMIEELISKKNIQENLDNAQEFMPENFGSVCMLYVEINVNKHPVQAFVDSGAQSTIMSEACAEKCGIIRLLDKRFSGVAVGVGTQKILGKIHAVDIQIMDKFIPCSLTILEGDGIDFLLGLDMLKRFQCSIDLKQNCLIFPSVNIQVPFLGEAEIKKKISITQEQQLYKRDQDEKTEQQPNQFQQSQIKQPQQNQRSLKGFKEEQVTPLEQMGFTLEEILEALKATNGNVELAAALLNERKYGF